MKLVTVKDPADVPSLPLRLEKNEHGAITRLVVGTVGLVVEAEYGSSLRVRKPADPVEKSSFSVVGKAAGISVFEGFEDKEEAEGRKREIEALVSGADVTVVERKYLAFED